MKIFEQDFSQLKVGVYCRKSSETEDKQVLSLESQLDEAVVLQEKYELSDFINIYSEAKSAKVTGNRPEFTRMVKDINNGVIDAIVCWKLDRLARNMTEAGIIIDMMIEGKIKYIITHQKLFMPTESILVMVLDFALGKQYIIDLSTNVKRGQLKKAKNGYPHGVAPIGFLNDKSEEKGNRKWKIDKNRLPKIQKLLEMFLTDTYTAAKLYEYAVKELHLNTPRHKKIGGAVISRARMYTILKDPIYAGFFFHNKIRYGLSEEMPRLITEEQHEKIKRILSKKHNPKTQSHELTYSGFMLSDNDEFVGQDVKHQVICDCKKKFSYKNTEKCPSCGELIANMKNPKYLEYKLYYNVTKKKNKQKYKSVNEKEVDKFFIEYVRENLSLPPELAQWSVKYIHELKDKELNDKIMQEQIRLKDSKDYDRKKSSLRTMLRDGQITDEEYEQDLEKLNNEYGHLKAKKAVINWFAKLNEMVDLTQTLEDVMMNGTLQSKKEILSKLGSNIIWDEENLSIRNSLAVNKLIAGIKRSKGFLNEFEPTNSGSNKSKNTSDQDALLLWLSMWDEVREVIIAQQPTLV